MCNAVCNYSVIFIFDKFRITIAHLEHICIKMEILFHNSRRHFEALTVIKMKSSQIVIQTLTGNNYYCYHSGHQDKADDSQDPSNELPWK